MRCRTDCSSCSTARSGDRIGKLRVMAACLAFFAVGTFACAFVPNLPVFAVLRFLTGVVARGGRSDVARLHRRQVSVRSPSDCSRTIHERVDDGPDCREHARRHVRTVSWLAQHLHRVRHRLYRRGGPAGTRGAAIPGAAENRSSVWIAYSCGAARRVGYLPGDAGCVFHRALAHARGSRRVSP